MTKNFHYLNYLYNLCAGHAVNAIMNLKQFYPVAYMHMVLICVELICADFASYGESFDSKFINVGCIVLENINLSYNYLIH